MPSFFFFYLLCFLAIPPKFTYYAHSGTYYAQKCIVKVKVHVCIGSLFMIHFI